MVAAERIAAACKDIPDHGWTEVFAPDVVEAGKSSTDERVKCLVDGAKAVIADYNRARAEFGMAPLDNGDPRLKVLQMAGELRHLLGTPVAKPKAK